MELRSSFSEARAAILRVGLEPDLIKNKKTIVDAKAASLPAAPGAERERLRRLQERLRDRHEVYPHQRGPVPSGALLQKRGSLFFITPSLTFSVYYPGPGTFHAVL